MQGDPSAAWEARPASAESWQCWDPSWSLGGIPFGLLAADGGHTWSYKPAVPFPCAG